jgi:hypothetical protein
VRRHERFRFSRRSQRIEGQNAAPRLIGPVAG